jgi:hypothetical protein
LGWLRISAPAHEQSETQRTVCRDTRLNERAREEYRRGRIARPESTHERRAVGVI